MAAGNEPIYFKDLFDNFEENPQDVEAHVDGSIPEWLTGTLLRNGPGMFKIGPDTYNHIFDGLALLQKFMIKNGKIFASTQFLRSDTYKKNKAAERIVVSEFGTLGIPDPCKSIFSRYFTYFSNETTDNAVVNFIQTGDKIFATSETCILREINPSSLETYPQKINLKDYVSLHTATAHPHYDDKSNIINIGMSNNGYEIIKTLTETKMDSEEVAENENAFSSTHRIGTFKNRYRIWANYNHSFGMSQNYVIWPEMPLVLNLLKLFTSKLANRPFRNAMEWHPEIMAYFRLLSLETGEELPQVYTANPFFTFHHANAYESERHHVVVVDVCGYGHAHLITQFDKNRALQFSDNDSLCQLWRFVLPTHIPMNTEPGENIVEKVGFSSKAKATLQVDGSIHCEPEILAPEAGPIEFPRINYAYNTKNYKFVYAAQIQPNPKDGSTRIFKIDITNGGKVVGEWVSTEKNMLVGEPVFIAAPNPVSEDDGVVVFVVHGVYSNIKKSSLVILDGRTFNQVAKADAQISMPFGFHCHFVE